MADGPQLYAIIDIAGTPPPVDKLAPLFDQPAVPSILLRPAAEAKANAALAPALSQIVARAQAAGTAVVVAEDVDLASRLGADGVHLTLPAPLENGDDNNEGEYKGDDEGESALTMYRHARAKLGPEAIIGVDPGGSRHVAMLLAEAGADYIAFGPAPAAAAICDGGEDLELPATQQDLVAWWAEVFEVPVVALDVTDNDDCTRFAAAQADFVAPPVPAGAAPADLARWLRACRNALTAPQSPGETRCGPA